MEELLERIWLDHERCYRALSSRDSRFDGRFYAGVRTTGIYCRPSCPARTPSAANVEFVPTAAAAQQRGFRACKRCRPDAAPGSPEWDVRADAVARAVRLIDDGVVDREGVVGLAARLGFSSRHLTRLLTEELGAGPLAIARSQRAHTARILLESTDLAITDVAFASGFSSIRQFNDTIRSVYAASPTELRRTRRSAAPGSASLTVRLPARQPFALDELFEFLARRAVPGLEVPGYARSLRLPHGTGLVSVSPTVGGLRATFELEDRRDLAPAVHRVRRLFDLDADPLAVDTVLRGVDCVRAGALARSVGEVPGLRVPGSVDVFETVVRAIIGQQVSVAGARTVTARLVAAVGSPLPDTGPSDPGPSDTGRPTLVFPAPDAVAGAPDTAFSMPVRRRATIRAVAESVASGVLVLDPGADRATVRRQLLELPGIGPWTADYVAMRGLHDPDVFLTNDLGVRHALARHGLEVTDAERWRPWRSYAVHHLWRLT